MSIAEFSSTIKSQAFRFWFDRISTTSILKSSAKDIRTQEQVASKTSFFMDTPTIEKIIEKMSGSKATEGQVLKVLQNLKNETYYVRQQSRKLRSPKVLDNGSTVYFPMVSFDTIKRIVDNSFSEILDNKTNIFDTFHRGHVFGIFPTKIHEVRQSLVTNKTIENGKQLILDILNDLEKELLRQDVETSNIGDETYHLYAKYKKSKTKYLVELQIGSENSKSGSEHGDISKAVRKYFNPTKYTNVFTEGAGAQTILKLIKGRGSPSMLDLIELSILETLSGKPQSNTEYIVPNTLVTSKTKKVDTSIVRKNISDALNKVKKAKESVRKAKLREKTGKFTSLASLQTLLNQALNKQIEKNMGTGSSRSILNYQTGRFAESVKVERISQSREGMLTAFYSYMKYPYATFEPGGRQGSPASRDPKLLISKSIREIASTIVTNRMRAVRL